MAASITSSPNYASKLSNTTINNLLDDSLAEIFCRLPCKSLFTSKSVSKRWFNIISDPNFPSLYLAHQHSFFRNMQTQEEDLDQPSFILKPYNALVITPKVPSLQLGPLEKHLSLSFLGSNFEPTNVIPQLRSVLKFAFGSSNGLLLCGNPRPRHKCIYHVCNILTKDTLELPCAPSFCDHTGVLVGFTCDPYYRLETDTVSVISSSQRRFRVVRIPAFSDVRYSFNVEVFYSETREWIQFVVSCPKGFTCGFFLTASSVEYGGKLYFTGGGKILVYDPYNDEQVASVIELPSGFGEAYKGCLGVSCGRLQLSEFPILPSIATAHVGAYSGRVWELQCCDCGKGEAAMWKLVHDFYIPDVVGPIFEELKSIEGAYVKGCSRILAFHPYIRDTLFFMFGDRLLCCNLSTRRFKADKYSGLSLVFYPIIPVVLPWWPTPVP